MTRMSTIQKSTTQMSTTRTFNALLGTMLFTAIAAPVIAAESTEIKPFTADYQANYMGMQANGLMTLAPAGGNRWKYNLSSNGSVATQSQTTVFEEHGGQSRPISGSDVSRVLIKKIDKSANYDWSKGVATWSGDVKPDRAGPVELQAGDMDGMLLNLALTRDVAAGRPLNYRMVDDGRAKQLSYTIAGKEQITVDGKAQQATKVVHTDGEKQTIAWVVEGLPVPARILQKRNGKDEMDLRIKSLR
jgi:hypothetical protein